MKRLITAAAALALLVAPMSAAYAQHHDDNHHDDHHPAPMMQHKPMGGPGMMMKGPARHDWHKGGRIEHADWNRGTRVSDYGRYHLSRPPRGYEWRRVDNNYVLAAAATGLIASVILANQ